MTSDDRLRHCARCGWRPEYGRHDGRTTCPGFVSVQNVPADPPVPFTEDELGSVWFAAALLESERADERAARAMQAGVITSVQGISDAFNAPIRKAEELRAALTAEKAAPLLALEQALVDVGIAGTRAAEVVRAVKPPTFNVAQIEQVKSALAGLGLTADETQAALVRLGLAQVDSTPLDRLKTALREVGAAGANVETVLARVRPPTIDPTQIERVRVALTELGLTAEQSQRALRDLGVVRVDPTPLERLQAVLAEVGVSASKADETLRRLRPPVFDVAQVERARAALTALGLTAVETDAALKSLGAIRVDPTPLARAEAALASLGVAGAAASAELNKIRPPVFDAAKIGEARAALLGIGATARQADAALLSLGLRAKTAGDNFLSAIGAQGKSFGQIITGAFTGPIDAFRKAVSTALGSTAAFLIAGFVVFNKFREGTTQALAFNKAMTQVSTIVDKTTGEIAGLREEVLGLAREFGLNELDVAKGLYFTLSSGIEDTADALRLVRSANELAVAGFADSQQVIDLLTTTINAYGLAVGDAGRLNDIFFATVKSGKAELPELAASLGTVLPIAAQMGVRLEEVNAAVATLTLGGRKADIATTGLRQVLINLLNPTADAQAIIRGLDEQLGIFGGKTLPEILKQGGSLFEVFTKLRTALGGNTAALRELVPDARAFNVVAALTGQQYETLRRVLDEVTLSAGASQRALEKVLESPSKRLEILLTGVRQGFESLGEAFLSALVPADAQLKSVKDQADALRLSIEATAPAIESIAVLIKGIGAAVTLAAGSVAGFINALITSANAFVGPLAILREFGVISQEELSKAQGALEKFTQAQIAASQAFAFGETSGFDAIKFQAQGAVKEIGLLDGKIEVLKKEIADLGGVPLPDFFVEGEFGFSAEAEKTKDRIDELKASLDELNQRRQYLLGFVGDFGAVTRSIEAAANKGTELQSVFDLVRTDAARSLAETQASALSVAKAMSDPSSAIIDITPSMERNAEALRIVEKALGSVTTEFEALRTLAARGPDELTATFPEVDVATAKADLDLLQKTIVRVPAGLIDVAGAAGQAGDALGGLGEEFDSAGARLKELQLAAARVGIGQEIALMAAQANEALAGIGGGFGARIATLKTQAVELRTSFEKAIAGIELKRTAQSGNEFGVTGSKEAAEREQAYRDAIERRFRAELAANESALKDLKRLSSAYETLLELPPLVGAAIQVSFAAAKLTADVAAQSTESLAAAMGRLNLTAIEKAQLDIAEIERADKVLQARLASDKLTESHRKHLLELIAVNKRAREEIGLGAAQAVGAGFADLLERAFPLVQSARAQLVVDLQQINAELVAFARTLPAVVGDALIAATGSLSKLSLFNLGVEESEVAFKRISAFQREALQAQAFLAGDFADRFVAIQNQTAAALESLPAKVEAIFGKGKGLDTLKLRKDIEAEIGALQLRRLTVDVAIQPNLQFEEGVLFDELAARAGPLSEKLNELVSKRATLSLEEYADGLREIRAQMRGLRSEVFDTAQAFQVGFSAGIQDFIDESTNAFRNGQDLASAFGNGLSEMFQSVIDGSASASDAIRQFGITILQEMNKIISQRLAAKLLDSLFGSLLDGVLGGLFGGGAGAAASSPFPGIPLGGTGFAEGGVLPGRMSPPRAFAEGGVMPGKMLDRASVLAGSLGLPMRAYEHGGIARTPQVAIFGEARGNEGEAFVPLKGGRIPVEMMYREDGRRSRRESGGNVEIHLSFDQSFSSLEPATAATLVKQAVRSAVDEVKAGFAGSDRDLYNIARGAR